MPETSRTFCSVEISSVTLRSVWFHVIKKLQRDYSKYNRILEDYLVAFMLQIIK